MSLASAAEPSFSDLVEAESPKLEDFSLTKSEKSSNLDLNSMNQADLLRLRAQIDGKLVGIRLNDLNLETELLVQYQNAKVLQEKAGTSDGVPMNQRAQVQNSLGNLLTELTKLQTRIHDSESIKRVKMALVRTLKQFPAEVQDAFFEQARAEFAGFEQELAGDAE